jgi:hypothetical protein
MQLQENNDFRVLCIYTASETYTSTVFEHLDSFRKYSKYSWSYLNIAGFDESTVDLSCFDAVVVHYSVRLPYGEITSNGVKKLQSFNGLKVLFIQDEYDGTNIAKSIIKSVGFHLVFSVVPPRSLRYVYPEEEFPGVTFVNNYTGYAPDELTAQVGVVEPPSRRNLLVAYRARKLPIRYGRLGLEKVEIGKVVKQFCKRRHLPCDIAWSEESRIYGSRWYRFVASARGMLGTESGSNVFDWDGTLDNEIHQFRKKNPHASEQQIYDQLIAHREIDGLMNQISPRVFEMAAARTVMVLFEGSYSDILIPYEHYIPLKKDFSNLEHVIEFLQKKVELDAVAERAFRDLIESGKYGYKQFVAMVDSEIEKAFHHLDVEARDRNTNRRSILSHSAITLVPHRARPPLRGFMHVLWRVMRPMVPVAVRTKIKHLVRRW